MSKRKANPPSVTTIGQLMDALQGGKTKLVSLPLRSGGDSLARRIREGRPRQPAKPPPELIDFDGLMRRCNKYFGLRIRDGGLLRAVAAVAEHKNCLIGKVRRMTYEEFNAALDEVMDQPEGATAAEAETKAGMSWQEAGERMEQLRTQGEPFTSQHKLARALGCSSGTINTAIRNTQSLQEWAKRPGAAPRAQRFNPVLTDSIAQSTEPDPANDAATREWLERASPDERAFFNGLSREDQLAYLDDPDKHGFDEQVRIPRPKV